VSVLRFAVSGWPCGTFKLSYYMHYSLFRWQLELSLPGHPNVTIWPIWFIVCKFVIMNEAVSCSCIGFDLTCLFVHITVFLHNTTFKRYIPNYIHSVLAQDLVSDLSCCVSQYHNEWRVVMRLAHTAGGISYKALYQHTVTVYLFHIINVPSGTNGIIIKVLWIKYYVIFIPCL